MTMGVNIAPLTPEDSTNATTTPVAASTVAVMIVAKPGRMGGTIYNRANKSLWIKQGDPGLPPTLTAAEPGVEVPANSNWDIPAVYDGIIGLIWSAGFNATSKALVVENMP
jgi:hypothetical protein